MLVSGFDVRFDPFDVFALSFFFLCHVLLMFMYVFFFLCHPVFLCFFGPDNNILKSVLKSEWFRETLVCNVFFFTALAKTCRHNICSL